MALRRSRLPKDGLPSRLPGNAESMQIWIKMNRLIRRYLPSRQIMHYPSQRMLTKAYLRKAPATISFRYWQRTKFARLKNGTRHSTSAGIKTLTTENNFHITYV